MVVQPPPHVVGVGLTSVTPPGVASVGGVGVQMAVDVHQTTLGGEPGHPFAFFGKKAAVLFVATPVFQIGFLVGDVDVAAQNKFAALLQSQ